MSEARFDRAHDARDAAHRALVHLMQAQEIVDSLDRPEIGARLQEVIDTVRELSGSGDEQSSVA